jgi:hypothetical protein
MKVLAGEDEFLASYDPRSHEPVAVTVDVLTLTIKWPGLAPGGGQRPGLTGRLAFDHADRLHPALLRGEETVR